MPRHSLAALVSLYILAFILVLTSGDNLPASLRSSVSWASLQTPSRFTLADTGSRASTATGSQTPLRAKVAASYGKLPLSFEANRGQTDRRVKFLSRNATYTLFLTGSEAVFSFARETTTEKLDPTVQRSAEPGNPMLSRTPTVLRMSLRGANKAAKVTGLNELSGKTNYLVGNDPKCWRTGVADYGKVKYEDVYPGTDLVYHGNQHQLEYDFVLAPYADPNHIAVRIEGSNAIREEADGSLLLVTQAGEVRWHKPVAYQRKNGVKHIVQARFVVRPDQDIGFEISGYDPRQTLTIDPVVGFIGFSGYSTYLGGTLNDDSGAAIAVDAFGNAYVTGLAQSADFPTTADVYQPTFGGDNSNATFRGDAFVTKINSSGTALVYSTFLGGSSLDYGTGIAVDYAGNAYVTGYTESTDFPTYDAYQTSGGTAFVTALNASGSALVYSTYIAGATLGNAIAATGAGNAYVTGQCYSPCPSFVATTQFIGSPADSSFDDFDAFVMQFDPSGSLLYSVRFGGSAYDAGRGVAVDGQGNAIVAGVTQSNDFPLSNAFQSKLLAAGGNAFVTKLNASGTALLYSTYLGGSGGDQGNGIAVDSSGNAYVVGNTRSPDFPTLNPFQPEIGAPYSYGTYPSDAFITKLDSSGQPVYSTFLGGNTNINGYANDTGDAIAVDAFGDAFAVGLCSSDNFPTVPYTGYCGVYVTEFNPVGSGLIYSTIIGGISEPGFGIAVDNSGFAYVTGLTFDPNFPTTPNAVQPECLQCGDNTINAYGSNAFVTKLVPASLLINGSPQQPLTKGTSGNFVATVTITNNGNVTINSLQVAASGTTLDGSGLVSVPPPILNLAAGASAQVTLKFAPSTTLKEASSAPLKIAGVYTVSSIFPVPGVSSASQVTGNWSLTFRSVSLP